MRGWFALKLIIGIATIGVIIGGSAGFPAYADQAFNSANSVGCNNICPMGANQNLSPDCTCGCPDGSGGDFCSTPPATSGSGQAPAAITPDADQAPAADCGCGAGATCYAEDDGCIAGNGQWNQCTDTCSYAAGCTNSGGNWSGTACDCSNAGMGHTWDGHVCTGACGDPGTCHDGGTWNASACTCDCLDGSSGPSCSCPAGMIDDGLGSCTTAGCIAIGGYDDGANDGTCTCNGNDCTAAANSNGSSSGINHDNNSSGIGGAGTPINQAPGCDFACSSEYQTQAPAPYCGCYCATACAYDETQNADCSCDPICQGNLTLNPDTRQCECSDNFVFLCQKQGMMMALDGSCNCVPSPQQICSQNQEWDQASFQCICRPPNMACTDGSNACISADRIADCQQLNDNGVTVWQGVYNFELCACASNTTPCSSSDRNTCLGQNGSYDLSTCTCTGAIPPGNGDSGNSSAPPAPINNGPGDDGNGGSIPGDNSYPGPAGCYNSSVSTCVCVGGSQDNGNYVCACPSGTAWNNGICVSTVPVDCGCGPGAACYVDPGGCAAMHSMWDQCANTCGCPYGYNWDTGSGTCIQTSQ